MNGKYILAMVFLLIAVSAVLCIVNSEPNKLNADAFGKQSHDEQESAIFEESSGSRMRANAIAVRDNAAQGTSKILFKAFAFSSEARRNYHRDIIYSKLWNPQSIFNDPDVVTLCNALIKRDYTTAESIVESRRDIVDAQGRNGMRLLHWATLLGEETFEWLLANGSNPDFKATSYYNVLNHAKGSFDESTCVNVSFMNSSFFSLITTLCNVENKAPKTRYFNRLRELLLKYGADPGYGEGGFYCFADIEKNKRAEPMIISAIMCCGLVYYHDVERKPVGFLHDYKYAILE